MRSASIQMGYADQLAAFLGAGHPPIHVTPHAIWSSELATRSPTPACSVMPSVARASRYRSL